MFKLGDKVIITKKSCRIFNVEGIIEYIDIRNEFYRVRHNYGRIGIKNNTCNIFYKHFSESIELDLQEVRNDKLKNLGI